MSAGGDGVTGGSRGGFGEGECQQQEAYGSRMSEGCSRVSFAVEVFRGGCSDKRVEVEAEIWKERGGRPSGGDGGWKERK